MAGERNRRGPEIGAVNDAAKRLQHIRTIFDAVMDLPPDERPAVLDRLTDGDTTLRREVEAVILRSERTAPVLESPAIAITAETASSAGSIVGERIGAYTVVRLIGMGGMGAVYEATRDGRSIPETCRHQDRATRHRFGAHAGTIPPRAPDPGVARASQHRHAARRRRHARRPPLSRHGVRRRRADHHMVRGACPVAPRPRDAVSPGLRGGPSRPQESRHSPRPQARQHPRDRRRHGQAARLRHRQAARRRCER